MNRNEFIETLRQKLYSLPKQEKEDILSDYQEHFEAGIAKGKTEEEIASSLGNPTRIAQSFKLEGLINKQPNEKKASDYLRIFIIAMALLFFNLNIVLLPLFICSIMLCVLWTVAPAMIIAVMIFFIKLSLGQTGTLTSNESAFFIFIGLGTICVGLLILIALWYVSCYFIKFIAKYVVFNLKLVKGE